MADHKAETPAWLTGAGFTEVGAPDLVWRNNALNLVPAQLFCRSVAAGEVIHLPAPDHDEIVMVKE